jgi:hypothetical protein
MGKPQYVYCCTQCTVTHMHNTGRTEARGDVRLQLDGPLFISIENWRRTQPKIPSRAEAIRLLVERGLGERDQGGSLQAEPERAS